MEIALNTYSLRDELKEMKDPHGFIIQFCLDNHISKIEYLEGHFEMDKLEDLINRLESKNLKIFSLASHCKFLDKPDLLEEQAIEAHKWIDLAYKHNVEFIRFQMGSGTLMQVFQPMDDFDEEEWEDYNEMIEEAIEQTRPSIEKIMPRAVELGIKIAIETHGSFSSNYVYMKRFNEEFTSKYPNNLGWCLDTGNFENNKMRWRAIDEIKDKTFYLHAKSYKYDDDGFEVSNIPIDFPKVAQMFHGVGFDGIWSIEFEGKYNGILGALQSAEWCKYAFAKVEGKDYIMKTDFPSPKDLMKQYKKI